MFKDDFYSKNYIPTFRNSNIAHKCDFYKANPANKRSIILRQQKTEAKAGGSEKENFCCPTHK